MAVTPFVTIVTFPYEQSEVGHLETPFRLSAVFPLSGDTLAWRTGYFFARGAPERGAVAARRLRGIIWYHTNPVVFAQTGPRIPSKKLSPKQETAVFSLFICHSKKRLAATKAAPISPQRSVLDHFLSWMTDGRSSNTTIYTTIPRAMHSRLLRLL